MRSVLQLVDSPRGFESPYSLQSIHTAEYPVFGGRCSAIAYATTSLTPRIRVNCSVMSKHSPIKDIREIAQDQWGMITRRQLSRIRVPPTTIERFTAQGSALERVALGVYHLTGAPLPEQLELRAAWLQLASAVFVWERNSDQGIVSHRSAAALYGLGHLPADTHEFTFKQRHQSRRADVRLHQRKFEASDWTTYRGLPVTRPARIASDLLGEREDPEAVAHIIVDALKGGHDYPENFASALTTYAYTFGLRRGDGIALLKWLLDLVSDRETNYWLDEARRKLNHLAQGKVDSKPNAAKS